jgi:uroporphyrinogen decarboxylase
MNDTFLRALLRQPVEYTPVWMMRQAGRYLPEYRATRKQAGTFMDLCRNADFATEVTLQPLARYALDAAILFSDILTVPDAMGLGLYFVEGEGPRFTSPLQTEAAIKKLSVPDMDALQYVFSAVKQIRTALNNSIPLIGFAGSPFTLACYMVEGASSRDFRRTKTLLYDRPDLLHHILAVNAEATTAYLNGQIAAGAQAIMIFDTWGGALSHTAYQTFSLAYMQHIVRQLTPSVNGHTIPVVIFTKGGGLWLKHIAQSGCHAVGLDWTVNLQEARAQIGEKVALQGNMDPHILFASPKVIEAEVARILAEYGHGSGHVFNLGHGISQFTPPEHVTAFINTVHTLSRPYHQ